MTDQRPTWDELPGKYGEEDQMYSSLYHRYSHIVCPGTGEDVDNCAAPWDCAYKGRCRMIYERRGIKQP